MNRRIVQFYDFGVYGEYYDYSYHNASWQLLERRFDQGQGGQPETVQPYWQYVWSERYIDAPVLRDTNTDTDGLCDDERIYYLTDANFNVTSVIDTSGQPVEHYQSDPYGRATVLNGGTPDTDGDEWTADPGNSTDVANHWLYSGRWQDYRSLFYRHRHYHAELGRFVSRDAILY